MLQCLKEFGEWAGISAVSINWLVLEAIFYVSPISGNISCSWASNFLKLVSESNQLFVIEKDNIDLKWWFSDDI